MTRNQRIKKALKDRRYDQKHLAVKLDISTSAVSDSLKGDETNSIRLVLATSELTGYSIEYLILGNADEDTGQTPQKVKRNTKAMVNEIHGLKDRMEKLENEVKQFKVGNK